MIPEYLLKPFLIFVVSLLALEAESVFFPRTEGKVSREQSSSTSHNLLQRFTPACCLNTRPSGYCQPPSYPHACLWPVSREHLVNGSASLCFPLLHTEGRVAAPESLQPASGPYNLFTMC